jgi:hypothetical protein
MDERAEAEAQRLHPHQVDLRPASASAARHMQPVGLTSGSDS